MKQANSKTAKIAISLPEEILRDIEKERRARGETRSEFFRRAVEAYLRRERERELDKRYIAGYKKYPETTEEIAFAEATMMYAFTANPWDEEDPE